MENWNFKGENETVRNAAAKTIRSTLVAVMNNLSEHDGRVAIPLGYGDPSVFPSFRPSEVAEKGITEAIRSAKFNGYAPSSGIPLARRAIAEHLSCNQESKVSPNEVHVTVGAGQAIDRGHIPKPGYPFYEARAIFSRIEVRYYDLLPEQDWEVDLHHLESVADENTVAMVITNPGNPCGNVYSCDHLHKIAEIAKRNGFVVIADETYAHLAFGSIPFTPMRVFGMKVPVLSLGSLSKRWMEAWLDCNH